MRKINRRVSNNVYEYTTDHTIPATTHGGLELQSNIFLLVWTYQRDKHI